jgi:hypothetical protein
MHYLKYSSTDPALQLFAAGSKKLSVTSSGGILHGSWIADNNVATSSRLLKTAIEDLPMRAATASLRPVTFRYKRGPEAKHIRFGFVAEEVAAAVPELVRTLPGGTLGIVMSDIVAIVFAKVQRVEQTLTVLLSMEARLARIERHLGFS